MGFNSGFKGSNTIQRGSLVQSFSLKYSRRIQDKMAYLDNIIRYKMRSTQKYTEVKLHRITCQEGTEDEQSYSSTLSLNSALDGGGW